MKSQLAMIFFCLISNPTSIAFILNGRTLSGVGETSLAISLKSTCFFFISSGNLSDILIFFR